MPKDLPSYEDFDGDESLPSIEDYITEENAEELPSVEDYIEIEEETVTIEDADGNTFAEVKDIIPPFPELIRLINDVREEIPDIPEIKYYDKELEELAEQISQLPEVKYYDREVEAICDQIDLVRSQIKDLPEVKYYDEQVDAIEDRIDSLQTDVANLPEVKYYDTEIEAICEAIDQVKASIPKFPKWVNEINEVPDFSWIGKTFSIIDDDFVKVSDKIEGLRGKVEYDLEQLSEDLETKHFNNTVKIDSDIKDLDSKVNVRIDEEKDKIWKEMRSSSLKMWEYHKEFKDDDRKLKKQILGEYNTLKKNINKELKEINYTSVKTDELLLKYFTELKEEISGLPEVKYYDKDIDYVKSDIKGLYKIIEDIKSSQKQLQEEQKLLAETNVPLGEDPPETNNSDPLTPLDQNFVTLDQLQQHYKRFVERVQYQLGSIGGGGAGFIKDLDDVDITGLADNYILQYDSSVSKWKTVANSGSAGAGGTWAANSIGIHTTKNVGVATTARSDFALYVGGDQYVDGNITVGGTITYEDVKNVDSLGIVTARTGVDVLAGGINVTGVSTFNDQLKMTDNTKIMLGASNDMQIVHIPGTGNSIQGTSPIYLQTTSEIHLREYGGAEIFGKFIKNGAVELYHDNSKQFETTGAGATVYGTTETQQLNVSGIATATKVHVGVDTGFYSEDFVVNGNGRVTGILTIGTGSITLDPDAKQIKGVDEIIIGTATTVAIKQDSAGEVTFQDREGKQASVGIGTTVSINTTGIITAATLKASTAFYPPLYTTAARDAGTFTQGAIIFNTTSSKLEFYDGTSWQSLPGMSLGLTVALDG